MRKRFLASTLASSAALLLGAGAAVADDTAGAAGMATAGETASGEDRGAPEERPGFGRDAVRALLADLFGSDEAAPAVPVEEDPGGLEAELGRRLRLELRYDSRGPFEDHLTDPRETEHFVFLQLRTRL